jgi:hypothetical protein
MPPLLPRSTSPPRGGRRTAAAPGPWMCAAARRRPRVRARSTGRPHQPAHRLPGTAGRQTPGIEHHGPVRTTASPRPALAAADRLPPPPPPSRAPAREPRPRPHRVRAGTQEETARTKPEHGRHPRNTCTPVVMVCGRGGVCARGCMCHACPAGGGVPAASSQPAAAAHSRRSPQPSSASSAARPPAQAQALP